jgi:5-methylcytosine-specific restriction enzyme A
VASKRNPPWHRDELILALDLYERLGRRVADDKHRDVVALSELLNTLPIHAGRRDATRFRNPNEVALKLANFHHRATGRGVPRGNRLEQQLWDEFAGNTEELAGAVEAVRKGLASLPEEDSSTQSVQYASAPNDIRECIRTFNREALQNQERARRLLQGTTLTMSSAV